MITTKRFTACRISGRDDIVLAGPNDASPGQWVLAEIEGTEYLGRVIGIADMAEPGKQWGIPSRIVFTWKVIDEASVNQDMLVGGGDGTGGIGVPGASLEHAMGESDHAYRVSDLARIQPGSIVRHMERCGVVHRIDQKAGTAFVTLEDDLASSPIPLAELTLV